mgnify:CR=1 FL=1
MIVVTVFVALAAAVMALARLNRSDAVVTQGSVAVTRDGRTLKTFTLAQVRALPSVDAHKKIVSSSHADEEGRYTGVPVRELLRAVDPALLDQARLVVTRASDGYVSSISVEEVKKSDSVLLVYAKDGKSLGMADDGGTGPFRIVILSDAYGNRCTKWVNEIEIR